MQKIILFILFGLLFLQATDALARDVQVNGYYRRDGTYVRPHIRSAPDGIRSNNYGPSQWYGQPPSLRDQDHDGIANRYDNDDDNDGIADDLDSNQYGC